MIKIVLAILLLVYQIEGESVASVDPTPVSCRPYSNDLDVIKSLPSKVSVVNEGHACPTSDCAWINQQKQVTSLYLTYTTESLQVYCLIHLRSLEIHSRTAWPVPVEISELTNLTKLNLNIAGNRMTAGIGQLKMLQSMTFKADEITALPGYFGILRKLQYLFVDAPLENIPGFLVLIPLETLILFRRSTYSSIPEDFFKRLNPSLRSLTIDITHLSSLDQFLALTQLVSLTVYADKLKEFPWEFTQLTALRQLNLDNNELSSLPQNFSKNFDKLSFNLNQFREIPSQILLNKNLSTLYMSNNLIADVSTLFQMRPPLKILFLGSNNITTLPETVTSLSNSLESLTLYNNKLTTVPAEVLVKMEKLRFLSLERNPITPAEVARLKAIFATNPRITVFF
ncbi:hypothetical protein I4U23_004760 [Adineta vaga]|nr:hypothetical protein I4U23_004760 [Adineta vaga]